MTDYNKLIEAAEACERAGLSATAEGIYRTAGTLANATFAERDATRNSIIRLQRKSP